METVHMKIEGVDIAVGQTGLGPLIFCLHGNMAGRLWYEKVMDIPGYRVAAPDMPNFGDSGRIESTAIAEYGRFMEAVLERLAPEGAALVVGHSLGGAVAMDLALRRPALVNRLLLVDPCPVGGLVTPEAYHSVIAGYRDSRELLIQALGGAAPALKDDDYRERLLDLAQKMKKEAFIGHAVELGKVDYRHRAAGFPGEVLVLWGELDRIVTEKMERATASAFPAGRFRTLQGVGHSVMVEDPPRFLEILTEFLPATGTHGGGKK